MDLVRSLQWVVIQYDQVRRERGNVDTGTREHGDGHLEAEKGAPGKIFPPSPWREPTQLHLRLLASRTTREYVSGKTPSLWSIVT